MINIFNVDLTGNLVIADEAVRAIPIFREVIKRDKGSKGDSQGRAKAQALKELIYIYYVSDLRSRFRLDGTKEKDIHRRAVSGAGLPKDYKVDSLITEAIEKYKEIQLDTPEIRLLNSLNKGLVFSSKVVDAIIDKIDEDLEYYTTADLAHNDLSFKTVNEEVDGSEELDKLDPSKILPRLISNMKEITTLGAAVNKAIDTVKQVEEKVKKQLSEEGAVRGGGELGNREMPS